MLTPSYRHGFSLCNMRNEDFGCEAHGDRFMQ